MKEEVRKFVNEWNDFIMTLVLLKEHWNELKKIREESNLKLDEFPDEVQKSLARVNFRSRFTIGIVLFIEYIKRYSSFGDCLVKIEKEKEEVDDG